jgi:DNA-binding response OmpR family regulator
MADPKTILIIEDDHFLSSLLKARLEKEGFAVQHASDGEEGIQLLRKSNADLIVLDLILPKLSGFEVLETIAADPQFNHIPVIILSNLAQESDIQKTKGLGAVDYFVKVKISIEDLIGKIKIVLEQAEAKGKK